MIPVSTLVPSNPSLPGLHTAKQQHVAARMMELFERRNLPDGNIPGERELADRLGVSRRTVRTVLQWLEQRGHIETHPSQGRRTRHPEWRSTLADTICLLGDVPAEAIPNIVRPDGRFATVQYSAAVKLRATEYHTLILQLDRMNADRCARLISDRPAGVVLFQHLASQAGMKELAGAFLAAKLPFVLHSDDAALKDYDFVCSDHDDGSYRLTKYLIERGCRRILRCWLVPTLAVVRAPWLEARKRGSERAIREAGLELLPQIEGRCDLFDHTRSPKESFEHGVRVAAGYLMDHLMQKKSIDAIIAPSDYECLCLTAACRKFGLTPGKDILLAGYDNYWAENEARQWEPCPPAVTADKRNAEIGSELIRVLLDRIAGKLPAEPQRRIVRPDLVAPSED